MKPAHIITTRGYRITINPGDGHTLFDEPFWVVEWAPIRGHGGGRLFASGNLEDAAALGRAAVERAAAAEQDRRDAATLRRAAAAELRDSRARAVRRGWGGRA